MSWEECLRNLHSTLLEAKSKDSPIRHNSSFVKASDLARQYFCEMKVEQEYIHGKVEKVEKEVGSQLHEELSQLKQVNIETLVKTVKGKRLSLVSMPLICRFNEVTILGIPDVVVFSASKPLYVMELKTTKRKPDVWPDSWLQAQIYAYLLDKMNFDCSKLNVVVASISQHGEIIKGAFFNELLKAIIERETDNFVKKWGCKIRLETYDRNFVVDKVGWALDYWLMKRDPIPTRKPGKCRSCEYAGLCQASLSTSSN